MRSRMLSAMLFRMAKDTGHRIADALPYAAAHAWLFTVPDRMALGIAYCIAGARTQSIALAMLARFLLGTDYMA